MIPIDIQVSRSNVKVKGHASLLHLFSSTRAFCLCILIFGFLFYDVLSAKLLFSNFFSLHLCTRIFVFSLSRCLSSSLRFARHYLFLGASAIGCALYATWSCLSLSLYCCILTLENFGVVSLCDVPLKEYP